MNNIKELKLTKLHRIKLQPMPNFTSSIRDQLQGSDGINIERVIIDPVWVQRLLNTLPIFVTPRQDVEGDVVRNSFYYFSGIQALSLIRKIPSQQHDQFTVLLICVKKISSNLCLKFAKSSLKSGLLTPQATWVLPSKDDGGQSLYSDLQQEFGL